MIYKHRLLWNLNPNAPGNVVAVSAPAASALINCLLFKQNAAPRLLIPYDDYSRRRETIALFSEALKHFIVWSLLRTKWNVSIFQKCSSPKTITNVLTASVSH